jgi:hypothetical protein
MTEFKYDEATLSIVCPVCKAAVTAKCLTKKSTGGTSWMEEPHAERFIAAHPPAPMPSDYTIWEEAPTREPITETDMWGEPLK